MKTIDLIFRIRENKWFLSQNLVKSLVNIVSKSIIDHLKSSDLKK